MTASPRSPSPSPAPSGTVRASSAFGIKKIDRRWRLCHEASFRQIGPLRDLYEDRRLADHDIVRKVGAGHRLRFDPNRAYAKIGLKLSEMAFYSEAEPTAVCLCFGVEQGR